jgi:hypothetical protein
LSTVKTRSVIASRQRPNSEPSPAGSPIHDAKGKRSSVEFGRALPAKLEADPLPKATSLLGSMVWNCQQGTYGLEGSVTSSIGLGIAERCSIPGNVTAQDE